MFKYYLKSAWRNIHRNKTFSAINISGLAISIASAILILLWIRGELTWDGFYQNKIRLYQVMKNAITDNGITTQNDLPYPLAEELKKTIPGIKHVVLTDDEPSNHLLAYSNKKIKKEVLHVSDDFLMTFSFPLTQGSPEKVFTDPNSIVITQSVAHALFNKEDPTNKIVRVDNAFDLKVAGVLKDVPQSSTIQFDCLIPMQHYIATADWVKQYTDDWHVAFLNVYAELNQGISESAVNKKIKGAIAKHKTGSKEELFLYPMSKWHLYSKFENGKVTGGEIELVGILGIIAAFIILIACFNYMNLSTAGSEKRAKEVGVRKAVGSLRRELIQQFIFESLTSTFIAFVIAIMAVQLVLPFFNELVQRDLHIDYSNPIYWSISIVFIFLLSLMSGSYPAFYLSSFQPVNVLKGMMKTGKGALAPRKVMVTLQFTFSILLIIATLVIYLQLQHLKDRSVGYDQNNLLMLEPNEELHKNFPLLKNDLLNSGLVESVSKASSPVTNINAFMGGVEWPGKGPDQKIRFGTVAIGYDYLKTIGASLSQGRDFSSQFPTDSFGLILNKEAVKLMGLPSPLGTIIKRGDKDYHVIGITENILMTSPYEPNVPVMILFDADWANIPLIRLNQNSDVHQSLAAIGNIYHKYCPSFPFEYYFTDQEYGKQFTAVELIRKLATLFASLCIFVSCLGLFGLAAFDAEQRRKEIGVRIVLGAKATEIINLLSKEFLKLVLIAYLIAAPLAWLIMNKLLQNFAYRINMSWWIFLMAGAVALLIAWLTISTQAIKAARANPVKSLRTE